MMSELFDDPVFNTQTYTAAFVFRGDKEAIERINQFIRSQEDVDLIYRTVSLGKLWIQRQNVEMGE